MSLSARRAPARFDTVALALILATAAFASAHAQDSDVALELEEAASLAVTRQPLLSGVEAQARAARESAIAARQLPDPQLTAAIEDIPINEGEAGSLSGEPDTRVSVGLSQEFPRAGKRRLRGELSEREAARLDAELGLAARTIRRDAALAWLELWRNDQALQLAREGLREARIQEQAVEIALRNGSATQAEFLGARLEAGRMQDAVAAAEQGVAHARSVLSRWIGEHALRLVCPDLPPAQALPMLETVIERVRSHPRLAAAAAQMQAARTGADLARAAYQPDWRLALGFGYRPAFSELVTLQVGVDLPLFKGQRQDRDLAAALAQGEAAQASVEDALRQLLADARLNHHDWERLAVRLQAYDANLLPQARNRIEAALGGWRSGRGTLRDVLEARRTALEIQLARLELEYDRARHWVELVYLGAFESATPAGEAR